MNGTNGTRRERKTLAQTEHATRRRDWNTWKSVKEKKRSGKKNADTLTLVVEGERRAQEAEIRGERKRELRLG